MKRFACITSIIFAAAAFSIPARHDAQSPGDNFIKGANFIETKGTNGGAVAWTSPPVQTTVTIEAIGAGGSGGIQTPDSAPQGTFQSGGGGGGGAYVKATMVLPANTKANLHPGYITYGKYPAVGEDHSAWFTIAKDFVKPANGNEGVVAPGGQNGFQSANPKGGGFGGAGGSAANVIATTIVVAKSGGNGGNGGAGDGSNCGTGGGGGGGANSAANGISGGNGGAFVLGGNAVGGAGGGNGGWGYIVAKAGANPWGGYQGGGGGGTPAGAGSAGGMGWVKVSW